MIICPICLFFNLSIERLKTLCGQDCFHVTRRTQQAKGDGKSRKIIKFKEISLRFAQNKQKMKQNKKKKTKKN